MTNPATQTAAAANALISQSYDDAPYPSFSIRESQPERQYTVGTLFGMNPPDFRKARVLELGCAGGGNILSHALKYAESRIVGIDLSPIQIDQANRYKDRLKLKNIEFLQKDVMKIDKDFGTFDYIIAHGLLSWVPPAVRQKILEICKNNLSPSGMAMISYNTYPGWHAVNPVRDIMEYHTGNFKDISQKLGQAMSILDFLADNIGASETTYKAAVIAERDNLRRIHPHYVYHDHLARENHPFYLYQFETMLKENDLQYVGDSQIQIMYAGNMKEPVLQQISQIKDQVRQEQYLDFLQNRRFRMSLITHGDVKLNRNIPPESIFNYLLTLGPNIKPEKEDPDISQPLNFKNIKDDSTRFTALSPSTAAFFLALHESGARPASIDELIEKAQKRLHLKDQQELRNVLLELGLRFAFLNVIELHSAPAEFITHISEKPCVYPLARLQAEEYPKVQATSNAWHDAVKIDEFNSIVMIQADGTRSMDELVDSVWAYIKKTGMQVNSKEKDKEASDDARENREIVARLTREALEKFVKSALLVA